MFVCLWVCYHDNSKLRASILTKLGLQVKVVTISSRVANRPGMAGIVPELTHGVPCPGRGSFCPGNVKIDHREWIYGCSLRSVLYFVFVSRTRLDLSVMSLSNEIVIIHVRLAANTINNDEMQQA